MVIEPYNMHQIFNVDKYYMYILPSIFSGINKCMLYNNIEKKTAHVFDSDKCNIDENNITKHYGPIPTCYPNSKHHMFQLQKILQ